MSRKIIARWMREALPKKCMNCGSESQLQYHHIVPIAYGGNDVITNVVVLCSRCHSLTHYGNGGIINHNDAVKLGIQRAKERGVHVGKKPADYESVMRLIAEKSTQFNQDSLVTEGEIMSEAGVKPVCYAKCKNMLFDAMKADNWPYEWSKPEHVLNRPLYDRVIKRKRGDL